MTFEEFKAAGWTVQRIVPTDEVQNLRLDTVHSFEDMNDCDEYEVIDSIPGSESRIEYDVYNEKGVNINLGIRLIGTNALKNFIDQFPAKDKEKEND